MSGDTLTATKLYNAAIRYLQRYTSSSDNLRDVLQRRVKRWEIRTKQKAPDEAPQWIAAAVSKCLEYGYVNDAQYAEQRVQAFRRQGRSKMYILRALQLKGIDPETTQRLLGSDEEAELNAAKRYVQRRRLGKKTAPEDRQKDLAKLVRAGFALGVAKQALNP